MKTTKTKFPALPQSHLRALKAAGFTVMCYRNASCRVQIVEGETRSEWLPRLCVGGSGPDYKVIEWMPKDHPDNAYHSDGYFPSTEFSSGGYSETIGEALAWFNQRDAQRAL